MGLTPSPSQELLPQRVGALLSLHALANPCRAGRSSPADHTKPWSHTGTWHGRSSHVNASGDRILMAVPNLEQRWELPWVARTSSWTTSIGQLWDTGSQKAASGNSLCMNNHARDRQCLGHPAQGAAHSHHPKPHCSKRASKTQGTRTASKMSQLLLLEPPEFWGWGQGVPHWFKALHPEYLENPWWSLQTDLYR